MTETTITFKGDSPWTPKEECQPAINVKVWNISGPRSTGMFPARVADALDRASKEDQDMAWDMAVSDFWNLAGDIAKTHGYEGVERLGREGGWLTPVPTPNVYNADERAEFIAFRTEIEELLEDVPELIDEAVRSISEEEE